jgi:hypothetical protein
MGGMISQPPVSALKEIGRYGSVGVEFIVTLGVGFFGGRWLDRRFQTGGALAWAGFLLGIALAFYMLIATSKRIQAQMEKDDAEEAKEAEAEATRAALLKASTPEEEREPDVHEQPGKPPRDDG